VAGELAQEGLRPVTPDQECLQDILHTHEEKAEETLKQQVCVCVCCVCVCECVCVPVCVSYVCVIVCVCRVCVYVCV